MKFLARYPRQAFSDLKIEIRKWRVAKQPCTVVTSWRVTKLLFFPGFHQFIDSSLSWRILQKFPLSFRFQECTSLQAWLISIFASPPTILKYKLMHASYSLQFRAGNCTSSRPLRKYLILSVLVVRYACSTVETHFVTIEECHGQLIWEGFEKENDNSLLVHAFPRKLDAMKQIRTSRIYEKQQDPLTLMALPVVPLFFVPGFFG